MFRWTASASPRSARGTKGADPTTVIARGSTYDNRANLAPAFLQQIVRKYEGTRLGDQLADDFDRLGGGCDHRARIITSRRSPNIST
jgi:phage terminase large subunit-like protein